MRHTGDARVYREIMKCSSCQKRMQVTALEALEEAIVFPSLPAQAISVPPQPTLVAPRPPQCLNKHEFD